MTRQTSIEAYHKIQDDGLLGEKAWIVYRVLFHQGPLTAGEIFKAMQESGDKIIVKGGVSARLTELREQNVVREVGMRVCSVTGHTVLLWDVTDSLPQEPVKKETNMKALLVEVLERQAQIEERLKKVEEKSFDPAGQGSLFNMKGH